MLFVLFWYAQHSIIKFSCAYSSCNIICEWLFSEKAPPCSSCYCMFMLSFIHRRTKLDANSSWYFVCSCHARVHVAGENSQKPRHVCPCCLVHRVWTGQSRSFGESRLRWARPQNVVLELGWTRKGSIELSLISFHQCRASRHNWDLKIDCLAYGPADWILPCLQFITP